MSIGSPIVVTGEKQKKQFAQLDQISTRRDDPDSFDETLLQELIDSVPNVLPVREYLPSSTTLFSLGREIPVDLGVKQGFIDNLLVTNDGYLVIVETKLYRNPEGIRDVITQTLQYGMAIGQMSIMELEAHIPALKEAKSIRECIAQLAAEQNRSVMLADDFEETFERHLHRGEMLLLVASDRIHLGVERVGHWLNSEGNSSPFQFGLVELKFFRHGDQKIVIPRTVLKTREVSRHVVVVDIRPQAGNNSEISAVVNDDFRNSSGGGKVQESRMVKVAKPPLTKSQLLQLVCADDLPFVTQLLDQLESHGLDQNGAPSMLRLGITYPEGGDFFGLVFLGQSDAYLNLPARILRAIDADIAIEFRKRGSEFGFYRKDDLANPNGLNVKYRVLKENLYELAAFLGEYRRIFLEALQNSESA